MKTWKILFEDGREYYYKGAFCDAVDYADSYNTGLDYEYTIEPWEEEEDE